MTALRGAVGFSLMALAPWLYWNGDKFLAVLCLCVVKVIIEWQCIVNEDSQ